MGELDQADEEVGCFGYNSIFRNSFIVHCEKVLDEQMWDQDEKDEELRETDGPPEDAQADAAPNETQTEAQTGNDDTDNNNNNNDDNKKDDDDKRADDRKDDADQRDDDGDVDGDEGGEDDIEEVDDNDALEQQVL
jgi:hypothetical protein